MKRQPPAQQPADLVGAGLILLAAACFGTLGPLSRFADDAGVSSLALVFWRGLLGAASMVIFIGARFATRRVGVVPLGSLPVRDRWFMAAAAVANTILNLAVFVAFLRISIALALLVFYLYPAFVALISVAWMGERLDRIRWIGARHVVGRAWCWWWRAPAPSANWTPSASVSRSSAPWARPSTCSLPATASRTCRAARRLR